MKKILLLTAIIAAAGFIQTADAQVSLRVILGLPPRQPVFQKQPRYDDCDYGYNQRRDRDFDRNRGGWGRNDKRYDRDDRFDHGYNRNNDYNRGNNNGNGFPGNNGGYGNDRGGNNNPGNYGNGQQGNRGQQGNGGQQGGHDRYPSNQK